MSDTLIIVPSRNRPDSVQELTECLLHTSSNSDICFGLDNDDISEYNYLPNIIYEKNERLMMGGTLNLIANKYVDKYKYICFMGDDHRPRTLGWDKILTRPLKDKPGLSYGNDLIQKESLPTAVVMSSSIIKKLGYMAPPKLKHLFLDNFWLDLGKSINSLYYFDDVIIEHMHPVANKGKEDELYHNSWSVFNHDKEEYENYKTNIFDEDIVKVMSLNEDTNNWA
jgi:hypothetical protein